MEEERGGLIRDELTIGVVFRRESALYQHPTSMLGGKVDSGIAKHMTRKISGYNQWLYLTRKSINK